MLQLIYRTSFNDQFSFGTKKVDNFCFFLFEIKREFLLGESQKTQYINALAVSRRHCLSNDNYTQS
jgi:hypothetical protein